MSESIDHDRRWFLATAAMTMAAAQFDIVGRASAESTRAVRLSNEGNFPSLGGATGWLNSKPLTPAALRGKVALVNFWTYTCVNWRRTLPYVRAWSQKYRDHGLVVIGVHTPEFSFEHNVDNVRWALRDMRIEYPVAVDSDYAIWRAFGNEYWPSSYFIDAKGHIRHHQFGEGEYLQGEAAIQQLLTEAGSNGFTREPAPVSPHSKSTYGLKMLSSCGISLKETRSSSWLKSDHASKTKSPKSRCEIRIKSAVSRSEVARCLLHGVSSVSGLAMAMDAFGRQHCLCFLPLPQGQGSFLRVFSRG